MSRFKRWNKWRKTCTNPWYQKLLVLFGIIKSPTFEMYYRMAEFMQSKMTVIQPDGTILGSPEFLEKYWDEYCNAPKDDCWRIKEPFLMFPKGTNDSEICEWFNKMYPGGLLELARKRQIKRFGKDYVKTWEKIGKRMRSAGASYFLSTPPDLSRTRELQANLRGQRAFIQMVDDAACLTEEDKKRLLQEFAEE